MGARDTICLGLFAAIVAAGGCAERELKPLLSGSGVTTAVSSDRGVATGPARASLLKDLGQIRRTLAAGGEPVAACGRARLAAEALRERPDDVLQQALGELDRLCGAELSRAVLESYLGRRKGVTRTRRAALDSGQCPRLRTHAGVLRERPDKDPATADLLARFDRICGRSD